MQNITVNTGIAKIRANKLLASIVALVILIAAILVFLGSRGSATSDLPVLNSITESALEQQYGLRVNLVAVTGAGGFVDVRLKLVDGEKARLLLADKKNFPSIMVNEDVVLNAPEDTKSQEIRFENDGNMFILYVNSANVVKSGSQVRILFGDKALDPITVR